MSSPLPAHPLLVRPRVHDLLRIDGAASLQFDAAPPNWVAPALMRAPWVVVRRAPDRSGLVAVGVRGALRSERVAAWLDPGRVACCVQPQEARTRAPQLDAPRARLPAMQALALVEGVWRRWPELHWGPGGSAGFELATACPAVTPSSDLDIVIRSSHPVSRAQATALLASLPIAAPARIDVLLETPAGGIALSEYARAEGRVMLRTHHGPVLTPDPWINWGGEAAA
ncbi:malonate decarboxylase holo-ACP synthase [Thiomonas sp. FB-Cd]|uniref:malonate decarboxylase holo-ACP synthase n=1 Tax=Thiomonas sp. FB-Cd TaxID=1158292 RepID=UPI000B257D7D|nr:malonate decarboxylase holo-ACP synthase [Thiomonas sp. FB-Cd]